MACIPTTSDARDVRRTAREASRGSLYFFASRVLGLSVSEEICTHLQRGRYDAAMRLAVAQRSVPQHIDALCRWRLLHPVKEEEAVLWLFPELRASQEAAA